jgi:hypothetical protein
MLTERGAAAEDESNSGDGGFVRGRDETFGWRDNAKGDGTGRPGRGGFGIGERRAISEAV